MHLLKYKYRGIVNNSIVRQQLLGSQCAWTSATATSLTFSRADSKHSSVHSSQSGAEFHPIVCHFHFSTNFSFLIFVASHFRFSSVPFFLLYSGFLHVYYHFHFCAFDFTSLVLTSLFIRNFLWGKIVSITFTFSLLLFHLLSSSSSLVAAVWLALICFKVRILSYHTSSANSFGSTT